MGQEKYQCSPAILRLYKAGFKQSEMITPGHETEGTITFFIETGPHFGVMVELEELDDEDE